MVDFLGIVKSFKSAKRSEGRLLKGVAERRITVLPLQISLK